MLSIKNVHIQYETLTAIDHLSLEIEPARITGLVGLNGAGKSSLLEACSGILTDFTGSIKFGEIDVKKERRKLKSHLGYAPEDSELMPYLTGRELLQMIGLIRSCPNMEEEISFLTEMLDLNPKQDELIINYSHGMRQKLSIAVALINRPELMILDEALNGLDALALKKLRSYLQQMKENGHTIILSSHILPFIRQWCDTLIVLHQGKVIKTITAPELDRLEKEKGRNFEALFFEWIGQ